MSASNRPFRLLITGGGTGGHLFPAIAAAEELRQRQPQSEVLFIGTRRKMDSAGLSAAGFASTSIHCYGLKGKSPLELCKALAILPLSCLQAANHLRRFKPDVVLGVGGYVTGPVMVAAKVLGIPTIIHEQNSIPGLANRQLGRLVDQICVSLPGSQRYFPAGKTQLTGNPVRKNLLALAAQPQTSGSPTTLLVLGGSQGAKALNDAIIAALPQLLAARVNLLHQAGRADEERVRAAYRLAGADPAQVHGFMDDMAGAYGWADLALCRSGASTIFELAATGTPAVLVPFPFAAHNHQHVNAASLESLGAAVLLKQDELTPAALVETVLALLGDSARLNTMSRAAKTFARPDAAARIADGLEELCRKAA